MEPIVVSWSGGKDSAFSLHRILQTSQYEVLSLLTVISQPEESVKMHGVPRSLLLEQARAIGFPLEEMSVPDPCPNEVYESHLRNVLEAYRDRGVNKVMFGDLFLEEIKRYRDDCLEKWGFRGLYPVWEEPTLELARAVIQEGFRLVITCVDTQTLDANFVGREFDEAFLEDLPAGVDPCGENGEFHTFVYDGPIFKSPVAFRRGKTFLKQERFQYCRLLPQESLHES